MTTEGLRASLKERTIGEIAATLPGVTAVFRKLKLDFCCGGDVTLTEAARSRGLDIASVEEALAVLDPSSPVTVPGATGALIDHILSRYHETHRRQLPELIRLARKVELVHAAHPEVPLGLANTLEAMYPELEDHMHKEETELFPLMRQGGDSVSAHPIARMRHDHDRLGEQVRHVEDIAKGFVLPEGACRSWQALYVGTAKLIDDLIEHIHLENNVLFPRLERRKAERSSRFGCVTTNI